MGEFDKVVKVAQPELVQPVVTDIGKIANFLDFNPFLNNFSDVTSNTSSSKKKDLGRLKFSLGE